MERYSSSQVAWPLGIPYFFGIAINMVTDIWPLKEQKDAEHEKDERKKERNAKKAAAAASDQLDKPKRGRPPKKPRTADVPKGKPSKEPVNIDPAKESKKTRVRSDRPKDGATKTRGSKRPAPAQSGGSLTPAKKSRFQGSPAWKLSPMVVKSRSPMLSAAELRSKKATIALKELVGVMNSSKKVRGFWAPDHSAFQQKSLASELACFPSSHV